MKAKASQRRKEPNQWRRQPDAPVSSINLCMTVFSGFAAGDKLVFRDDKVSSLPFVLSLLSSEAFGTNPHRIQSDYDAEAACYAPLATFDLVEHTVSDYSDVKCLKMVAYCVTNPMTNTLYLRDDGADLLDYEFCSKVQIPISLLVNHIFHLYRD
ncbi:hypothetical protein CRYUN_Cryun02cG0204700 [Craigia yunnanensis]